MVDCSETQRFSCLKVCYVIEREYPHSMDTPPSHTVKENSNKWQMCASYISPLRTNIPLLNESSPPSLRRRSSQNAKMTTVFSHWLNQSQDCAVFNKLQINQLEKCFLKQRYLSAQDRGKPTQFIGLTSTQVCSIIISLGMNLKKVFSKIPQM